MSELPELTGLPATLRDVLTAWDPLGVMPWGAPPDEYDCMIPGLVTLVGQAAPAEQFVQYLGNELVHHFGLQPNGRLLDVADHLARLEQHAP